MCSNRKFRRFMALLLTIVMVFGTVGTSVSASEYGGSTGNTSPITPGPGNYSGAFYTSLQQGGGTQEGVRYSLVKVDKDAVATQITSFDQYETLGVYDAISSELDSLLSNRSAYTKLYFTNMRYGTGWVQRLNALDYEVGVGLYGSEFLTTVNMYAWDYNNMGAGNGRDIGTLDNFYDLAVQIYGVYYGEGTSEYDEHVANLNACKSDFITTFVDSNGNALADGALLTMTTSGSLTGISGETGRSVGENNELLNALVMVLSAAPYLDDTGALPAQYVSAVLSAEDFIAEGDDYCYRILAEPTCVTYCSTSEFYLTTMRDIFTLQEIYYPSQSPLTGYTGYYDDGTLLSTQNKYILSTLTYAVCQTADEFIDYDKTTYSSLLNADQSNAAEALSSAIATWKSDNPSATPAFTAYDDGYFFPDTGGQLYRIERAIFQGTTETDTLTYGAYSLAILSPFNFIPPTEELGIVTIVKEEDGTGKKLEGATFKVEDVTDPAAIIEIGEFTTDSNGEIELDIANDGLEVGHTYTVTESDPPTGYELIDTPQEFTIVEDSDGNLSADPSTLTFEDPAAEGEAHLLIDYNMNGFSATVGTSGGDGN